MLPWKIKICGITNPADAQAASEYGADALGLNFYSRSLRSVSPEKAASIIQATADQVSRIGVFVNETNEAINAIAARLSLNAVQLHGDESPDAMPVIHGEVIRAVRVFPGQFAPAEEEIRTWIDAGAIAILLDAAGGGGYGGSGKQLDWDQVAPLQIPIPLILAGGLNCDNVARAIATVRPSAVDVASGVEKFPGKKDQGLLQRFIETAQDAFARI